MADTITVNVADQAFPPPPPTFQALPENLGVLSDASAFAGPFAAFLPQSLPPLTPVFVADQGNRPAIDSGVPIPTPPSFFITDDNAIGTPAEYIVSPSAGNFQTGLPVLATIVQQGALKDGNTGGAVTGNTTVLQITLSQSLTQYGLNFIGKQIVVLTAGASGTAGSVGQIRTINYWSQNVIFVDVSEDGQFFSGATYLGNGATFSLPVQRENDEVVYQLTGQTANAFPSSITSGDNVTSSQGFFQGNIAASSGVASPFIGSGQRLPPFVGTFEVENQPVLGGLPVNVFVG